jgi:1A family penicillin-binding protein
MKKITLKFLVKEIFLGVAQGILLIFLGIILAGVLIYRYQTPDMQELTKRKIAQTSVIYDSSGKHVLYEIHGEENRKILAQDEIPDMIRVATVVAEDKSFYSHPGIDPIATARALEVDIRYRDMIQGGSTITQQLARNAFLDRQKTISRKFIEAILALKIERSYTKSQILDLYLNEVPYGSNAYGIGSASEVFFRKEAKNLTLDEAALLAALPKAPTFFSPYGNHRQDLVLRQRAILERIKKSGLVSDTDIQKALSENTLEKVAPFRQPIQAPHFVFYVIEELENKYGREFLETNGLRVYTTLDYDLQKIAEQSVAEGAVKNVSRGASNAALIALDPRSGKILAMVGSKDYFNKSEDGEVNVTISSRQPGSSFKPIVYATAFENGFQPETKIVDAPTNFGPDGSGGSYVPRNYDGKFHGEMTMRQALSMSLNIPAIKTLSMVGIDKAKDMAKRLGITTITKEGQYGLSMAIGGAEVRPLDLTSAFSVFADDGIKNSPYAIEKIFGSDMFYYEYNEKGEQVVDQQVARKINSILSDNTSRTPIFGSHSPLFIPGKNVAAKTGTTQEFRDAWTVGYTPFLAVGIWCGNNDGHPMAPGSDGVFVAAPIWRSFMDKALENYPSENFTAYESAVVSKSISAEEENKNKKKKKGSG